MKLIPLLPPIDDLSLNSTNVAEGEAASPYNPATNYALDQYAAVGALGELVTTYRSLQNGNIGHAPASSPDWWRPFTITYLAWNNFSYFLEGHRVLDTVGHRTYESLVGTTATITTTIASPCVVGWTGHGLAADTPIVFQTTNSLPTGLVAGTTYYVRSPTANTFNVSATAGGVAINTSGGQAGVHTGYANPNINQPLSNPLYWQDRGPSNRWAMLDNSPGTVTSNPNEIIYVLNYPGRLDTLSFQNVSASAISVVITFDGVDDPVLDQTYSMVDNSGVSDWWSYFYTPISRKIDLTIDDIPPFSNPTVAITIVDEGSTPSVGALVAGMSRHIGETEIGMGLGIRDYSKKAPDPEFGTIDIVERGYSKHGTFKIYLPRTSVDRVHTLFRQYRATAALWRADGGHEAATALGFYKDFNIEVAYDTVAVCSLEIEGLT